MKNYPESFMIHNWYLKYKKYTIKTEFMVLPKSIIDYIETENFIHPEEYFNSREEVSEFKKQLKQYISNFGRSAFIKLLWSSPKDSDWLTFSGTAKITDFNELCLVLKNSESLTEDLRLISEKYINAGNLALREPVEIIDSLEFRCFVKESRLIAICQRNTQFFFSYLYQMKPKIILSISKFIQNIFIPLWRENDSYVIDVFLNADCDVRIMDIAPFDPNFVDPILYEWEELIAHDSENISFKIILSDQDVVLLQKNRNSHPCEFHNLAGISSEDIIQTAIKLIDSQELDDLN